MSGIPRTRLRIKQSKPLPGSLSGSAIQVSERFGIPSERLMDAAWLGSDRPVREGPQK